MRKWIFRTASTVTGVILPPIVGTFVVFAIIPLIKRGHYPGPFWPSLLAPIVNPEILTYAFIMMGPSALVYALLMTWLGSRDCRITSRKPRSMLRFVCFGAGIGLLSPFGTLVWASKYASLMDYVRWFALTGPAGAVTGALCAFPIWAICKNCNK